MTWHFGCDLCDSFSITRKCKKDDKSVRKKIHQSDQYRMDEEKQHTFGILDSFVDEKSAWNGSRYGDHRFFFYLISPFNF